ncbi:neck protein [Rhizobium phage RHph_I1_18]|nr:neck protein [Rhizobium phage RHph_I1_18]
MASNPWFNNYTFASEQNLYEDLVVEAIRQYAHDVYYLPRTGDNQDDVMNEMELVSFNSALPVEVYIKNTDAFEGDGQLLGKFGLEVRDQMTLNMSKRSFTQFVKPTTDKTRPWEGDIIFIPMLNVCYQIKYVKSDAVFYTLGKLNMYEIVLDLFENSGERFETGNATIDNLYPARGDVSDPGYSLEDEDNGAENNTLETAVDGVLDLSETDPFTE